MSKVHRMLTKISNHISCDLSKIHKLRPQIPKVPFLHLRSIELVATVFIRKFFDFIRYQQKKGETPEEKRLHVSFVPPSFLHPCFSPK